MEEGIHKTLGDIHLSRGPAVDTVKVLSLAVVSTFVSTELPNGNAQQSPHQQQRQPNLPLEPPPHQKPQEHRSKDQAQQAEPDPFIGGQVVVGGEGNGARLPDVANVLKHQWVVPEPELIVVAQGEAPDHHPGDQKGQPGPTQQEIHQKQSQNHRQDVQHRDKGVLEIAFHQHVRVVAVGEKQRQHPQAQARQQQNQSVPKPEGRFLSSGKSDGRTLEQPKVFQMGHLFCEKQD